jgi:fimbrial chaperone protein
MARAILVCVSALLLNLHSASAASLQVAPVLVEVPAPGAASTVSVRNTGAQSIMTQLRIFRWSQDGGEERLEPTNDVVASPPFVELKPQQNYTIRIIRAAKRETLPEESFRLVIDELPQPRLSNGTIAIVLRHVLPVFFVAPDASPAQAVWKVARSANTLSLEVANNGDRRLRLAAVHVKDERGRSVSFSKGLLGYVLGRSSMTFRVKSSISLSPGSRVTVSGSTEAGPFNATSTVQGR